MGFRDIQLFNQAMLAKQGWRLITKPNTLCARMLKGKYYHDFGFMSANKKRNSVTYGERFYMEEKLLAKV
jgi:hypothetical protein